MEVISGQLVTIAEVELNAQQTMEEGIDHEMPDPHVDLDRSTQKEPPQLLKTLQSYKGHTPLSVRIHQRPSAHPKIGRLGRQTLAHLPKTLAPSRIQPMPLPMTSQRVHSPLLAKSGIQTHPSLPQPDVRHPAKQRQTDQTTSSRPSTRHPLDPKGKENTLLKRKIEYQETLAWWADYCAREKEEKGGEHQRHCEDEEEKKITSTRLTGRVHHPKLQRPQINIFALYYLLSKMGIRLDGLSAFANKQEIEEIDAQTTEAHKQRLEEIKKALEAANTSGLWSAASGVVVWMAACTSLVTGITMLASGTGLVAGGLLMAAGLIQVTSEIISFTNIWHKIATTFPTDDPEERKAWLYWIQIGISVTALALAAVAALNTGDLIACGQQLMHAYGVIGGGFNIALGVISIGEGISKFMYRSKLADVKRTDRRLEQLKGKREDLMEQLSGGIESMRQLFSELARLLNFEAEMGHHDQIVYRG